MKRPPATRFVQPKKTKLTPSRFAPAAFRTASPEAVTRLCEALAKQAVRGFVELTGANRKSEGPPIVKELRASGHDLVCLEDTAELQQWQATLYHPQGTYSLFITFRAPRRVEVTWQADDVVTKAEA
ncbi:MAG: hypothetical protein QM784_13850 [Polyangiaceae bacterium]